MSLEDQVPAITQTEFETMAKLLTDRILQLEAELAEADQNLKMLRSLYEDLQRTVRNLRNK